MAEFALGLTKTAVEGTLSLVKSAIEEEKKLRDKVQNDLVFITGEFEVMESFLHVANREHSANDKVALTLVRQLRTLAFDVEDYIQYVVHLDLDKSSSSWGWLRRVWQRVNCRAPPLPLDLAVAEIKQLKERVEYVSQRNMRYNLILHGSDNKNNNKYATMPPPPPPDDASTYDASSSPLAFHILRDAWEATGKWSSNMCNLQQELLMARESDHDLRVISVWGRISGGGGGSGGAAAGSGMASILAKAYCDLEICKNFKIRAWVKLTHPFNQDEFVKSLLAQLYVSSSHQGNTAGVDFCAWMKAGEVTAEADSNNLVKAKLMQQMREQRYVVVLEDVLTVAEWDVIRVYLPDSKNGSRILLSTPQLGIALLCTGEQYQVSELRNFSGGNQFLCAFSKKQKTPSDVGEFYRHLLRGHGVISVWGDDDDDKSNLIDILYKGAINDWLEETERVADKSDHVDMFYKGIRNRRLRIEQRWERNFKWRHNSWVDVPDPFNLKVFAQRLFLSFHSDEIRASEITKVGMKGEAGLIQWCREFLSKEEDDYPYIVVINGLQSKVDWDLIQSTFFSSGTTTTKGCILVVTNEETVATLCVKDRTHLVFNAKDLKADPSISTLINKGCWHYAILGGKKGRLFYDRRKDAQEWNNRFKNVGGNNPDPNEGKDEEGFRVFRNWFDRLSDVGVLRHAYYGALFRQHSERCRSWVDVWDSDDINLTDFSWRLLLDFYSDDPQAKEEAAVGLMEGTIDPIEKCLWFLGNEKCLVVINGLWSTTLWNSIKATFFSEQQHIQSIVIVGHAAVWHMLERDDPSDINTTTHTSEVTVRVRSVPLQGLLGSQPGRLIVDREFRRIFSTQKRYQEAVQWVETQQLVGRDWEVGYLDRFLVEGSLFSVWGIPGVGKSTLIRTVYYNEILRSSGVESSYIQPDRDHQAFAWVDVPSLFNLTEFAWSLLLDFYSDDPQAKETATVSMMEEGRQVPILECCRILRTGKCLVVIDGLRSKQDWDLIKATFLAEPVKATIVVITNEQEVAMHCAENDKRRGINITRLQANDALSLLEKTATKDSGSDDLGLKVFADKCGGLPKVIASIGTCDSITTVWSLMDNFMGTLETDLEFHGLRPLFSWMQSYFDGCSDSIKPCIFYLSIFSAEKDIRLRRLLWRWIAEGYCRDTLDGRTCEQNGEKFISELVNLSIIQELASNSKVFCQINGFFHEYIISRPMEDNLVFALEEGCSLNSQRAGQHLTIRSGWDRRDRIVYESIDFSRLRSLTVFGKWESFFICNKNVNMRLLRVLDLEDATDVTDEDLEQIVKLLCRLKFLSLRGHTKITCLPSSMHGLRQLQTLDIRGTSIVTLPLFITKLQKLQYMRAGTITEVWDWDLEGDDVIHLPTDGEEEDRASAAAAAPAGAAAQDTNSPAVGATPNEEGLSTSCNSSWSLLSKLCGRSDGDGPASAGVKVPVDIGKLAVLHTLGVIRVNAQCCKELKKLTQLRKLGVSGINKGNIHEFCEAISGHAHLKSLSMEVEQDDELVGDIIVPKPPTSTLTSLKLSGRVNKLLLWVDQLEKLEKLNLDVTIPNPEELVAPVSSFTLGVRALRIRPIQDGELPIGRLLLARVVEIQCSSALHLRFENYGAAGDVVEVLKVHFSSCRGASLQISGLGYLIGLKEVWLKGYNDPHRQYMQRQIDELRLDEGRARPVLKLVQTRSS